MNEKHRVEAEQLETDYRALATRSLLDEAAGRMVPAPLDDGSGQYWEWSDLEEGDLLTEEGIGKLKADLAADRNYDLR